MNRLLMDSRYYKNWLKHSQLKESAKYAYSRQLMRFEQYLSRDYEGELDFDHFYFDILTKTYRPIDADCIDGYIQFLKEEYNATKNTLFNNIVYLKNFFELLYGLGLILHNPMKNYPNPYYERRIIDRSLSIDECRLLFQAALQADPFVRKYFTLLLLMTTTALRSREIIQLTYDQIDFERNVIYVDKGQKTTAQAVYMPDTLVDELKRYLQHDSFEEWRKSGRREVFFENNRPLTKESLNKIIKRLCKKAVIQKNVTARSFRHTAAYLMQSNGIDITIIKRLLRHKHLSTTLRYVPPVDASTLVNHASPDFVQ
ncbi:tyrosine-type recombinase/integrase [Paenibacillus naphthalenovorans]|uniref:tyrosine-type recombinase/integrase n=1 Tax=Paenibacillus naphthalenovorans TaxID=162209 RepID=UPI0008898CA6|nr:site-specific integrase [Paenibacillus naphthalenovorans]SDJ92281.1 integrase/recombinase XerD [Paenibacillus naphthalenovorans]